jgi:hypothetical protein
VRGGPGEQACRSTGVEGARPAHHGRAFWDKVDSAGRSAQIAGSACVLHLEEFRRLGYDSYLEFLVPGMVVLSMLFTALQSGLATVTDIDMGMMDKFLTSPIRRSSVLLGRVIADAITMLAQGAIIVALAVLMGARPEAGGLGVIAMLAYATLFGVVWAGLSNLIALRTRISELTMASGLFLTLPAFSSPRPSLPSRSCRDGSRRWPRSTPRRP